jgi:hypothetical protein
MMCEWQAVSLDENGDGRAQVSLVGWQMQMGRSQSCFQ